MVIIDTNVLARYFLKDSLSLYQKAVDLINQNDIYLDEVVVSEIVWLLSQTYELPRSLIASRLIDLLSSTTVHNPRKGLIIAGLVLYRDHSSFAFADCWLHILAQDQKQFLATFDKKLHRYHKRN